MIRPLRADDIDAVTSLYQRVVRGPGPAPAWLAPYFRDTLLDHPWYDDELPSLVSEEPDGALSGLIGVHVRRLRFDGRAVRLACSGQLVADPSVGGVPGVFLVRAFLAGAQDISITDGANASARAIWTRLGGAVRELESISWTKVLRPIRGTLDMVAVRARAGAARSGLTTLGAAVDAVWERRDRSARESELTSAPLDAEQLPSLVADLGVEARVTPDYDPDFARWLLGALERSDDRGELRARVVHAQDSSLIGAFVYYRCPGGRAQVINVLARRGNLERVVDLMLDDARAGGAALLTGRLEPGLASALEGRRCILRRTGEALVHSRDEELLRAVQAGESALSLLEGEYWMVHHRTGA